MKRNRKQNIRLLALILILLLGIGFAALAANLKIDGTLNVSRTSWDVHFENVSITEGSVEANPAPVSDDTTTTEMAYTINFTKPGDYFEFTTDIVNDGTIDAMVDVVSNNAYANASSTTPITLPTYLTSTVTYEDGVPIAQNQELLHNTSEKIKVRVEFKTDINVSDLPSSGDTSMVFKFIGDYKQADETSVPKPVVVLPEGKTKDNLTVGDTIKIKNEEFNFIRYDGDDIVMLAKYNLKVGNIYDSSWNKTGQYTSADTGYGLQSSEARGYVQGASSYNGTVAFSATNYWHDSSTDALKPEYGTSYPADVYDAVNYKTEPDFSTTCDSTHCFNTPGYSVAYYVDNYKTILTGYGATIKDARLLKYSEAIDTSIGCNASSKSCPTTGDSAFITNTSFWLGSANYDSYVWYVYSDGYFNYIDYGKGYNFGVRPVVVISKSNI